MSTKILHGPEFKHPVDEGTVGQFFFKNAEKFKDRTCHIDGTLDQSETYGSVKLRSTRVAIALQKRGVTSEDVIIFCSLNSLDNTIPMFASLYLGAKVASLEPSLSVRHTNHLLSLTAPKLIFVEESAVNLIEESLAGTTFETEIIVFGESKKYSVFSDLLTPQENEEEFRPLDVDPDDVAMMLFSSGTTGLPKAICHSNRSILWVTLQAYRTGMKGAIFHFTSFYWMTAWVLCLSSFKSGGTRISARRPSPEETFKIIEKYKVTFIFTAPILTYPLTSFEDAHKYDTSSVRLIACGGTPMAPSQIKKIYEVFPTAITLLSCGMSEVGLVAGFDGLADFDLPRRKPGSCGKPGTGVQLKVVDPDTEELLGPDQKGEIRVKSPTMMAGYYRADSTQAFDGDGFLKTGDIGYYDEDGYVYVIERIKEMFKYQSWHIIPSTIETVLVEHPKIKEAVVFGLPADEDGEVPAACVVLEDGETLSEGEIDEFLKERVADRVRLRGGVTFVDSLPRTPTGKIVRSEVKNFVINLKNSK